MLLDEDVGPSGTTDDLPTSVRFLAPDRERRFQRGYVEASALHRYLVDEVCRRFGDARPRIILCCGKCRVGSTPLANVFGHAGIPALYQPMKTLLRHRLVGEVCPDMDLSPDEPIVFIKETFGPYVDAECTFSPLQVLLDVGFRPSDIKLILMERRPEATIKSWWQCWDDRIRSEDFLDLFCSASRNVYQTATTAAHHGVDVEYYFHEESKTPSLAVPRLFESLGLLDKFDMSILGNWSPSGSRRLGTSAAVRFFDQPKDYDIEDIHLELNEYRFVERRSEDAKRPLGADDSARMDELCRLYDQLHERTNQMRRESAHSIR